MLRTCFSRADTRHRSWQFLRDRPVSKLMQSENRVRDARTLNLLNLRDGCIEML
jgi:hypothetical protein